MVCKKDSLSKKALYLSYFTVIYNIVEGIVSIAAGSIAGSIALVGFGLDSFIESLSGSIMIWRFSAHKGLSEKKEQEIEGRAIKLIAYTFFILGSYVLFESVHKLINQEKPNQSILGVIITLISIIVMAVLYKLKTSTAKEIGSKSLSVDSKQTLACIFLSISVLIGLVLNFLFGLWYADPIVGLIIVVLLFKEGYSALKEEKLCSC